MGVSVLFLISCVLTARIFEKRKMRAAAITYSVLFISVLFVLAFAVDIPILARALNNALGTKMYRDLHSAIAEAINTKLYGFSMIGVICVMFIVQSIAAVVEMARAVAVICFKKKALVRKFKKAYFKFARSVRNLYLPKRINLLYCRMLN